MRRAALAVMFAVLTVATGPAAASSGARDPSIVVGILATLTGAGAIAGQDVVDGFNVALKQVGGRFANQEVRVVVADDKGSPDVARQQVKRLLERERLDLVITAVSSASLAAALRPLIEAKLFVLNVDNAPSALAGPECSQWVFEIGAPPSTRMEVLGQYLTHERMRRVMVIGANLPPTAEMVAELQRTFQGEILLHKVKPGEARYGDQIERAASLQPDAVVSLLSGGMGTAFLRAWGETNLKKDIPAFAPWRSLERTVLPALGDGGLDVMAVATWSPDLDNPANKRMQTEFDVEYGRPSTTWSARGYDAALLLEGALKATGGRTADPDALRAALRRADFHSVRGSFRFASNHTPVQAYVLRKVARDAKGRLTNETRQVLAKDWRDRQAPSCPMRWEEEIPPPPPPAAKKPG
ncbi:MAG: ABC transporter substrate-binding protein [Alphaproteobacteria bacterium]|nr:ABC transporter substrate-binding protein [Alphaproteobacteria bacterium]